MSARSLIRRPAAAAALRLLRALACALPLAWVLGGGCTWAFSTNNHSDDDNNDGTTVVVTSDTADQSAGDLGADLAGLDPALFELGDICIDGAPLVQRASACHGPDASPWEVTPARVWKPEQIGEAELAAFATAVLRVNEDRLDLPLPVARLKYLGTCVVDGAATVQFGDQAAPAAGPAGGAPALAVEYAATGEVVAIARLAGDRSPDLR